MKAFSALGLKNKRYRKTQTTIIYFVATLVLLTGFYIYTTSIATQSTTAYRLNQPKPVVVINNTKPNAEQMATPAHNASVSQTNTQNDVYRVN